MIDLNFFFFCRQAADQKLDRDKDEKKEQEARKKFKVSDQHEQS